MNCWIQQTVSDVMDTIQIAWSMNKAHQELFHDGKRIADLNRKLKDLGSKTSKPKKGAVILLTLVGDVNSLHRFSI